MNREEEKKKYIALAKINAERDLSLDTKESTGRRRTKE